MQAAWYERLGPAEEVLTLGTLPQPEPTADEVLVRVHASGINPSDVKKRAGWHGGTLTHARVVPHSDGAGEIVAVGSNVSNAIVGSRVWLYNAQHELAFGTAATYIALPQSLAVALPDNVPFREGACLGVPACTAYDAVLGDGAVDGLTVLVAGGAGAVGHMAVQIAARSGACVLATVSSDEKARIARDAGAEHVINYRHVDVASAIRDLTAGDGVDRIIEVDLGANVALDADIIKPHGVVASYSSSQRPHFDLDYYAFGYKGVTLRFIQVYSLGANARQAAIVQLNNWLADGTLRSRIADTFALQQIVDAHRLQESGHAIGNVVLELSPSQDGGRH